MKRSFHPVVDERTRVLLLGSLPGEQSLAASQYYAHPRNQFWRLIGEVIRERLDAMPYQDRLETLLASGVGLWDVIESATRTGSLDGSIRDSTANDLLRLARSLPSLRAVGFNGGKAASIGTRQLAARTDLALVSLPSSSPAYTLSFAEKSRAWAQLRQFL